MSVLEQLVLVPSVYASCDYCSNCELTIIDLSEQERIPILMMRGYDDRIRLYSEVNALFNGAFPDRNPIFSRKNCNVLKTQVMPSILLKRVDLSLQQMNR